MRINYSIRPLLLGAALNLLAGGLLALPARANNLSESPSTAAPTSLEDIFTEVEAQGAEGGEVTLDDSGTQVTDAVEGTGPEEVQVEVEVPVTSADPITLRPRP